MYAIKISTNNQPRDIVDAWELSADEREEFDYLDWPAIESGNDSAQFFRYRGQVYDLGEFMTTSGMDELKHWHGYASDSYFSGIVVRYCDDYERVIVGTYCG